MDRQLDRYIVKLKDKLMDKQIDRQKDKYVDNRQIYIIYRYKQKHKQINRLYKYILEIYNFCKPESFNTNILHQLFDNKITFVN